MRRVSLPHKPFFSILSAFVLSMILLSACGQWSGVASYPSQPDESSETTTPLYLCLDDSSIDDWYENRDLFNRYGVRVTFYITRFTMLSEDQVEKLHSLKFDGHSIQFHSTFHERAAEYLETHTIDEYIENEVFIGLDAMRAAGFNPVSFAYPGGSHTPSLDAVCLTIFETLRVSDREGPNILFSVGIDNNSSDIDST